MGMRTVSASQTGTGHMVNQDSSLARVWITAEGDVGLIAVADGLGGHACGEMASGTAIRMLSQWSSHLMENSMAPLMPQEIGQSLDRLFANIHGEISRYNSMYQVQSATTLTIAYTMGCDFVVKNIGDTRCYQIQGGRCNQLSRDDTWSGKAHVSSDAHGELQRRRSQNLLTRCLGLGNPGLPHTITGQLLTDDILMICSDGFYKNLSDDEVTAYLYGWCSSGLNPVRRVLSLLGSRGEKDDITVSALTV